MPRSRRRSRSRGRSGRRAWVVIGIVLAVVVAVVVAVIRMPNREPLPGEQRCVATASGRSVALDTGQAHYAALIAGIAVRRGLAPRAASIALATAYQESNLRNLNGGDRDSVGLFQQRPSQGWGSRRQLLDPYYATGRFYTALTRIDGWQNGDITQIAQKIQISGFPDAYRQHESDARILASVFTGQSPAGLQCLIKDQHPGNAAGLAAALHKTFGVPAPHSGSEITVHAPNAGRAWAYASFALANARGYGVTTIRIANKRWQLNRHQLTGWQSARTTTPAHTVTITVRPG